MQSKKDLSEADIKAKYITPAIKKAGWDEKLQIRREVSLTEGKVIVRGKMFARGTAKRADYVLYHKPNIPVAIIKAKVNRHSVRSGIQQALGYRVLLEDLLDKLYFYSILMNCRNCRIRFVILVK